MSNSINKKLINPTVKKFFMRRDTGQVVFAALTGGVLAVSGYTSWKVLKSGLMEDYGRNRSAQLANGYRDLPTYNTRKEGGSIFSGLMAGFIYSAASRAFAQAYLKRHSYTPLSELLHLRPHAYFPVAVLMSFCTSYVVLKSAMLYYDRNPHKLDRMNSFPQSRL
eukprot:TRINITY_DN1794_c3_g1_i1.p1 TRINITY_DN1794_c3_g1~~TRINITY_DN1794_c3_g1_i1.p1  ORF type:complete len:188 (+),score=38.55 TRINITY_DN1794_c3_g1_i1:70-564(+)